MFSSQLLAGIATGGLIVLAGWLDPVSDSSPAPERVASAGFEGPVRADVVHVIDGDTFEANAQIWLGESIAVRVRIAGIDAPELHARCDDEYRRAQAARPGRMAGEAAGHVRIGKHALAVVAEIAPRLVEIRRQLESEEKGAIAVGRPVDGNHVALLLRKRGEVVAPPGLGCRHRLRELHQRPQVELLVLIVADDIEQAGFK